MNIIRIIFIFLFTLLFTLHLRAQEWELQHPEVELDKLSDVYVSEDGNGWAVGAQLIFHTTDSGANWQQQSSNISNPNAFSIHYMEGSSGMRAYLGNSFLHQTTDGGISWVQQDLSSTGGIYDIQSPIANTIILMAANKIFHSSDDGLNWEIVLENSSRLQSLSFGTSTEGWVSVKDGGLYHTSDSGASWKLWASPPSTEDLMISFTDENIGFANAGRHLYATTDGGMTWELKAENAFSIPLKQLAAANATQLYGYSGNRVYFSSNGGSNWSFSTKIYYGDKYGRFHTRSSGEVWLPCRFSSIFHTTSATNQWDDQIENGKDRLKFIRFYDDNIGLTGGGNRALLKTTDGGDNWVNISNPTDQLENYNDILFLNENEYLLAGDSIYRSDDGGQSWTSTSIASVEIVGFYNSGSQLYAMGNNGRIYWSEDDGLNWQEISNNIGSTIFSVFFLSESEIFAGTLSGLIYKTEDGGDSWVETSTPSNSLISDIYFINENTGFATVQAWSNTILYSNDGGQSWSERTLPATAIWNQIHFIDEQNGWICEGNASSGRIIQTSNGGQSWEEIYLGSPLFGIEVKRSNGVDKIWAAGIAGIIEHNNILVGLSSQRPTPEQLVVFPSPTTRHEINMKWPENIGQKARLTLSDVSGKVIMNQEIQTNTSRLVLPNISPGIYFIKATNQNNDVFLSKILVQ